MDRLFGMMAAYGLGVFSTAGAVLYYDTTIGLLVMTCGMFFIMVAMVSSMKYRMEILKQTKVIEH